MLFLIITCAFWSLCKIVPCTYFLMQIHGNSCKFMEIVQFRDIICTSTKYDTKMKCNGCISKICSAGLLDCLSCLQLMRIMKNDAQFVGWSEVGGEKMTHLTLSSWHRETAQSCLPEVFQYFDVNQFAWLDNVETHCI